MSWPNARGTPRVLAAARPAAPAISFLRVMSYKGTSSVSRVCWSATAGAPPPSRSCRMLFVASGADSRTRGDIKEMCHRRIDRNADLLTRVRGDPVAEHADDVGRADLADD